MCFYTSMCKNIFISQLECLDHFTRNILHVAQGNTGSLTRNLARWISKIQVTATQTSRDPGRFSLGKAWANYGQPNLGNPSEDEKNSGMNLPRIRGACHPWATPAIWTPFGRRFCRPHFWTAQRPTETGKLMVYPQSAYIGIRRMRNAGLVDGHPGVKRRRVSNRWSIYNHLTWPMARL